MTEPRISVIVPCARMAEFLPTAVASIMRQNPAPHEIVVAHPPDDDVTARTCSELQHEGAPIVAVSGAAGSPAEARNTGIAAAEGQVLAFLDADDLWAARKLELQMARIQATPSVDAVSGATRAFEQLDNELLEPDPGTVYAAAYTPSVGTLIVRRSVLEEIGTFDVDFLFAEDVDFFLRMRDHKIRITVLREEVLYYRRHERSMMASKNPRMVSDFRRAALLSARRRKALGLPPAGQQLMEGLLEPEA